MMSEVDIADTQDYPKMGICGVRPFAIIAVPIQMSHLVDEVTDDNPNSKIWIAYDKGLNIVKIGKMNSSAPGFRLIPEEGVPKSKWATVPCNAIIPSSRTAV
eukprot:2268443-Prymnesium_polylepis.1